MFDIVFVRIKEKYNLDVWLFFYEIACFNNLENMYLFSAINHTKVFILYFFYPGFPKYMNP